MPITQKIILNIILFTLVIYNINAYNVNPYTYSVPLTKNIYISNGTYYFESLDSFSGCNIIIINATVFVKNLTFISFANLKIINSTLIIQNKSSNYLHTYNVEIYHNLFIKNSTIKNFSGETKTLYIQESILNQCYIEVWKYSCSIQESILTQCRFFLYEGLHIEYSVLDMCDLRGEKFGYFNHNFFKDTFLFFSCLIVNTDNIHKVNYTSNFIFINNTLSYNDLNKTICINIFLNYEERPMKAKIHIKNNTIYSSPKNTFVIIYVDELFCYGYYKKYGKNISWDLDYFLDYSFENNNKDIAIYYDVFIAIKDADTKEYIKNNYKVRIETPTNTSTPPFIVVYNASGEVWLNLLTYYFDHNTSSLVEYTTYKFIFEKNGYVSRTVIINMPKDVYKEVMLYRNWNYKLFIFGTILIISLIVFIFMIILWKAIKMKRTQRKNADNVGSPDGYEQDEGTDPNNSDSDSDVN